MSDTDSRQTRSVEIPDRTAAAIARRLPRTEFESVDDYVEFVLDQLLDELHGQESGVEQSRDDETDESVESRLESLGYL